MGWLTNLAVVLAVTGNQDLYFSMEYLRFPFPLMVVGDCRTVNDLLTVDLVTLLSL